MNSAATETGFGNVIEIFKDNKFRDVETPRF